MWYATNKKTRVRYGPYNDQERNDLLSDPASKDAYNWERLPEKAKEPAPQKPVGADKKQNEPAHSDEQ